MRCISRLASRVAIATTVVANATQLAYAQCEDRWMPGSPLASFDGRSQTMTLWDPDGPGPLSDWLVVGGGFSIAREIAALNVAAWDGTRWHSLGPGLTLNDESPYYLERIYALTVFDGQLIAGGDIRASADQPLAHIARWDGTAWLPLADGLNGVVRALSVHQGELIAAGTFTAAGEVVAHGIARWNGARWAALGLGIDDGVAYALAEYDGDLIAAGTFWLADQLPTHAIARWDGASWHALGDGLEDDDRALVNALTVFDGSLMVGGQFASAGGRVARNLAEWDGQSWRPVFSEMSSSVDALEVINGELVAAGASSNDGINGGQVFRVEGGAWVRLGPSTNSAASDLIEFRGRVVACGPIGAPLPRYLAQWDEQSWRGFGSRPDLDTSLDALVEFNGELVGGSSYVSAESARPSLLRWDGHRWIALGLGQPRVPASAGGVSALAVYQGSLFAGGVFSIDGQQRGLGLVRLEDSAWLPVSDAPWVVSTLCVYRDELVVGGFAVGRWNGSDWQELGPGLDGDVLALTVYRDELIAAGRFERTFDGQSLSRIAAWNGTEWRPLGAGINWEVYALAVHNDRLIAGGNFGRAGDVEVSGIAQWDGAAWSAVGPNAGGGPVYELTTFRGDLIAAGEFTVVGGTPARGIARWDGNAWHAFDSGITEYSFGYGAALAEHDGALFVSGLFTRAGERVTAYWARWMPSLSGDVNIDGDVDIADLYDLLSHYGMSQDATPRDGDTDADGDVDLADLANLLGAFGATCP
jgi:hypothetical protein